MLCRLLIKSSSVCPILSLYDYLRSSNKQPNLSSATFISPSAAPACLLYTDLPLPWCSFLILADTAPP